jgi:hypothetical protein
MAMNRAFTTLSYNGDNVSDWPDGEDYPEDYSNSSCITSPNCTFIIPFTYLDALFF